MLTLGLNDPKDAKRQVKDLFDEWDLKADKEKAGLHVWTDESTIKTMPELAVFSKNAHSRTFEQVQEGLCKCTMFLFT
jgi:hypothetical protein